MWVKGLYTGSQNTTLPLFWIWIPYRVSELLNAEGHIRIINVIVNRLCGEMQQQNTTLLLQVHEQACFNCLLWASPQLFTSSSPGSVGWMPLDIPRSWLIRRCQTSSMITSSTWSFSWQTTTQQCKTTWYFSPDRRAMVRLPEPSRACLGFFNNTWEIPQGLWLWVRQALAWNSLLLSAAQACTLSKVCSSPWPQSPVHTRPPLIIREL